MQLRPGDRVDHYTLLEPLGEGGQGAVWKILDPRDGGVARALKLISLAETGPAAFDRARREARILAAAKHPSLVTCHSLFEDPRAGLVGLVMDLVPGRSLAQAADEGRLDRAHGVAVLVQVADALAYIHRAGLAHRDLKPENILLSEEFWTEPHGRGTVKLVDFGIAAPTGDATKLTTPGAVIGTLPYLAPELVDPASWGRGAGPSRDVFAFGVLACRMLLGKHPTGLRFDAAIIDFARAYKAAQVGKIAWPPQRLEGASGAAAAAAACLALRPADRPTDGAAILALLRAGAPASTSEPAPTSTYRPSRGAVSTEVMPSPPVTRSPEVPRVRTIPAAPAPTAFATERPRSRVGCWLSMLVFLGACAGVVAIGYELDWMGAFEQASPRAPATAVAMPLPTPEPSAPATAKVAEDDSGACCPVGARCAGPTTFPREQCGRTCAERPPIPRGASWQLRIEGVMRGREDLVPEHPSAEIGMRAGASVQTLRFSQINAGRASEGRLPITTEDVENSRVTFQITEGDTTLAAGPGRVMKRPVLASALCAGLKVYIDAPSGEPVVLSVYLDR